MIYVFLAPGFEESEAICPIDILRRAKLDVVTVSVTDDLLVTGAHGIAVKADALIADLDDCHPQAILLPGGMPGTLNLEGCEKLKQYILASREDALLCAICAAPMILGKLGLLAGKKATCYPGFEKHLTGATLGQSVERDGNIITACGMGVAQQFGLAIVEALVGADAANAIGKAILLG